jgi:hypothetical protein
VRLALCPLRFRLNPLTSLIAIRMGLHRVASPVCRLGLSIVWLLTPERLAKPPARVGRVTVGRVAREGWCDTVTLLPPPRPLKQSPELLTRLWWGSDHEIYDQRFENMLCKQVSIYRMSSCPVYWSLHLFSVPRTAGCNIDSSMFPSGFLNYSTYAR